MSFKANLVALFNYNKANLKEGVVLEELTAYDVFCVYLFLWFCL